MSALEFLTAVAQVLFVASLIPVTAKALRLRTRAEVNIAIFFAVLDLLLLRSAFGLASLPVIGVASSALFYALPYLMLRLLIDYSGVPRLIATTTAVAFVAMAASAFVYPTPPVPAPLTVARTLYFVVPFGYAGAAFARLATRSSGASRRRMQAIAAGNILFAVVITAAGILAIYPSLAYPTTLVIVPGIVATAVAWFAGFAPPPALRRYWREPELRDFLSRSALLPKLATTEAIVRELERRVAAASGASATIGLWSEERGALVFLRSAPSTETIEVKPGELIAGRCFVEQRALFTANPAKDYPEGAAVYRASRVGAAIAAPISIGEKRLGVLCTYAAKPPIFTQGDRELVVLLAEQAAIVLESHALIEDASRARASEEAARLKEDFVSAAAHDLKTPLTALYGRTQLLQRQLRRGEVPAAATADRIVNDVRRLAKLVDELLDASRIGQGWLALRTERLDLRDLIHDLQASRADWLRVRIETDAPLPGAFDRARVEQVIDNLVENALKYGAEEQPVTISATREGSLAHLRVHDDGIGIPEGELEDIFERFHRGSNVEERHFAGMGLGLYICRGIVEAHGGRIWAQSEKGKGATLHVTLPLDRWEASA